MPVPLPPQPAGQVLLPTPPNDPPTLRDISNATRYNRDLRVSKDEGIATHDDVGRGALYEAALVAHHVVGDGADGAGVPVWFAPALTRGLIPLNRLIAKTYNLLCGDGRARRFRTVLFLDGSDPHQDHGLPALVHAGVIDGLTAQQCTHYLNGYEIPVPVPNTLARRKIAIRREIGCAID